MQLSGGLLAQNQRKISKLHFAGIATLLGFYKTLFFPANFKSFCILSLLISTQVKKKTPMYLCFPRNTGAGFCDSFEIEISRGEL